MPLPKNSSISLQGHSRPGEGTTTRPKVAMVVRMTEDALDALQNLTPADKMDFELGGDKPVSHPSPLLIISFFRYQHRLLLTVG